MNRRNDKVGDHGLTAACFQHLFGGLFASRLRLAQEREGLTVPSMTRRTGIPAHERARGRVPVYPAHGPDYSRGRRYLGIGKSGTSPGSGGYVAHHRHRDAGDS